MDRRAPLKRTRLKPGTKGLRRTGRIKPRQTAKPVPRLVDERGVHRFRDGREVCDKSPAGRAEYAKRTEDMRVRQDGRCGLQISRLCPKRMEAGSATFDHEVPRSGGRQDDRIEVQGRPLNRACCWWCNGERGSRSLAAIFPGGQGDPLSRQGVAVGNTARNPRGDVGSGNGASLHSQTTKNLGCNIAD